MANMRNSSSPSVKRTGAKILMVLGAIWLLGGILMSFLQGFFPIGILWHVISLGILLLGVHYYRHADDHPKETQLADVKKTLTGIQTLPATKHASSIPSYALSLSLPDCLSFAENPFSYALEDVGPDGMRDESGVVFWLSIRENRDIHEIIQAAAAWVNDIKKNSVLAANRAQYPDAAIVFPNRYMYQRYCELRKVIVMEDQHILDSITEEEKQQCEWNRIHFVAVVQNGVLDLLRNKTCPVSWKEWPGSADDAATYGSWTINW
ncbi:MAG: hypothetical protein IJ189_03530 [Clostridia bacterium]|nr:hypothetical protein [Clostridia bacterium]